MKSVANKKPRTTGNLSHATLTKVKSVSNDKVSGHIDKDECEVCLKPFSLFCKAGMPSIKENCIMSKAQLHKEESEISDNISCNKLAKVSAVREEIKGPIETEQTVRHRRGIFAPGNVVLDSRSADRTPMSFADDAISLVHVILNIASDSILDKMTDDEGRPVEVVTLSFTDARTIIETLDLAVPALDKVSDALEVLGAA